MLHILIYFINVLFTILYLIGISVIKVFLCLAAFGKKIVFIL